MRSTDLTRLRAVAEENGVVLPDAVRDALDFRADLPDLAEVTSSAAAEIASAFGTRSYAETRDAALARVASAQAAEKVGPGVRAALFAFHESAVVEHVEEIASRFAASEPVVAAFEALNEHAARVPVSATADSPLANLDDHSARFHASAAAERLVKVAGVLAPIYGVGNTRRLSAAHAARVILAAPPEHLSADDAHVIVRGFSGVRSVLSTVAMSAGERRAPGLWFALVASAGCRFSLAGPAEHEERLARLDRPTPDALRLVAEAGRLS